MAKILSGKEVSARIKEKLKAEVAALTEKGVTPGLAVVIVGNDPASKVYTTITAARSLYQLLLRNTSDRLWTVAVAKTRISMSFAR